jgi:hypothetical protein
MSGDVDITSAETESAWLCKSATSEGPFDDCHTDRWNTCAGDGPVLLRGDAKASGDGCSKSPNTGAATPLSDSDSSTDRTARSKALLLSCSDPDSDEGVGENDAEEDEGEDEDAGSDFEERMLTTRTLAIWQLADLPPQTNGHGGRKEEPCASGAVERS